MTISVRCPGCGKDSQLGDSMEYGFCMFCGTRLSNPGEKDSVSVHTDLRIAETEDHNGSDLRPDPSNPPVQNDNPDIRIAVDGPVNESSTETFDDHGPNLMPSDIYISSRSVVWVEASPRLKKVLEIEIKGFPQRFEVAPGQRIALPPVEGRRLVLFHLRGGGGGNKKFLELTVSATVTVNPAPGLFGGLLPIDIR